MSIVNTKAEGRFANPKKDRCHLCDGHLNYPWLEWAEKKTLFICSECCHRIKNGFTCDLIEIAATVDLRRVDWRSHLERKASYQRRVTADEAFAEYANADYYGNPSGDL
jgi:hypothetical protein